MLSSVPTISATPAVMTARLPVPTYEVARDAMTPISTPSELGSPCPRRGFKAGSSLGGTLSSTLGLGGGPEGATPIGIQGLIVETDAASYASDFESDFSESPTQARGGQWDGVEDGGGGAYGGGGAAG